MAEAIPSSMHDLIVEPETSASNDEALRPITTVMPDKSNSIFAVSLLSCVLFFSIATAFCYRNQLILPQESRAAADIPAFNCTSGTKFTLGCEKALADHFFLRDYFLGLRANFLYCLLNSSAQSDVRIGKNGWLFLGYHESVDELCGLKPFTKKQLTSLQEMFEARAIWLKQRNCKFVILTAPAKETVYVGASGVPTIHAGMRLQQFIDWMRRKSFVEVIDLTEELRDAARTQQVYAKYDSHWNASGALIGYRALMSRLSTWFPNVHALKQDEIVICNDTVNCQFDLGRMMHLTSQVIEPMDWFAPKRPTWSTNRDGSQIIKASSLPKAAVIADSFFELIKPLFAQHFSEVRYIVGSPLPTDALEDFKPDIVVQEFNEMGLCSENPADIDLDQMQAEQLSIRADHLFNVVQNSQKIVFGPVVQLEKAELANMSTRILLKTTWTPGNRPNEGEFVGIHILDEHGNILQQFDHKLIRHKCTKKELLIDYVSVSRKYLANATSIGLLIYADPSHVHIIQGGRCDLENHRLLLPLPKPTESQ